MSQETAKERRERHKRILKERGDNITLKELREIASELPGKTYFRTGILAGNEVNLVLVCVDPKKVHLLKEVCNGAGEI